MKTIALGAVISFVVTTTVVTILLSGDLPVRYYYKHMWGKPAVDTGYRIPAQYVDTTKKAPVV